MRCGRASPTTRRGSRVVRLRGRSRPQDTGFVEYSRTNAGSSYHDRMVTHRFHGRLIVAVAVALGLVMALVCWLLSASGAIGR